MEERSHLAIGEVLSLLRDEFPDVTISKIRFLESQGLVDPERTPSGYRKFYDADVERLRWILLQQKEHFLPLKVIKDRLTEMEQGPGGFPAAVGGAPVESPVAEVGVAEGRAGDELVVVEVEETVEVVAEAPNLFGRSGLDLGVDREPGGPPEAVAERSEAGARASSGEESSEPEGSDGETPDQEDSEPNSSAQDGSELKSSEHDEPDQEDSEPNSSDPNSSEQVRSGEAADAGRGSDETAVPAEARSVAALDPRAAVVIESAIPDPSAPKPHPRYAATGSPASGGAAATEQARATGGAEPSASGPPKVPGLPDGMPASGDPDTLTLEELAAAAGLDLPAVAELQQFGLVTPSGVVGGTTYFDQVALEVARTAAAFGRHGVEARHLRAWRNSAEREVSIFEQVVMPLLRQRNPQARTQAESTLAELAGLGAGLRAALVRQALRSIR